MFFVRRICILLILLVFPMIVLAQSENNKVALKNILQNLEKQHKIVFNYIENDIIDLKFIPPKKTFSLNDKIVYLEAETNLVFENINNYYFNISKNNIANKRRICGYVFSKIDNYPLENANIYSDCGSQTSTDNKGYFEIILKNCTEISVSHLGFKPQKISITNLDKNSKKITLEEDIAELSDVITNKILTSGIYKKNDGSFEIKPKKLGILPGLIEADVLQTMQQIPGVNSADESVASINVRGGTHDQNLFLWNGIKMYQTGHFFGLISVFNPQLAQNISIYKNGSSAFYGESVSSVVDISSNPNHFEKNNFSIGLNMLNADIYARLNLNKTGFLEISGRKSINDIVELPTYKQYFQKAFQNTTVTNFADYKDVSYINNETFNFYDFTAKYSQKIGLKNELILDLITINDQLKVFQEVGINNTVQSENNALYQKNHGESMSFKHDWNSKNTSKINVYSSSYELDASRNNIENNQTVTQENLVLDNGLKLENNHQINPKFTFNNGYQYNEIGVTNLYQINSPDYYTKSKNVLRIHAAILETKYNDSLSKISINTGLRINYIEQFKKALFEPRLQFHYGISKSINLEVLGEVKNQNSFQVIDLQTDYFGIEKRHWVLSNNETIPIQKSKQVSINLSFIKNNWLISFENFYKKINGINSSEQGFQNQLEFLKINGNYEVLGTEVLVQKKINRFITWLSYTFNDSNYYFPEFSQSHFSNNFELDHVVSWAGIYEKENFKIAIGSKWYSGRPFTSIASNQINYSNPSIPSIDYNNPNDSKLKSFLQINFSTTYNWKKSDKTSFKLGFSLLNVLNRQNEISEHYRINSVTNSIENVKTYSLKRTPNVSFRMLF